MTTTSYTPFPLASDINNPDIYEPVDQAAYQTDYNSFTALMGTPPALLSSEVNYYNPQSAWAAGEQAQIASELASSSASAIPLIALPLFSDASGTPSTDAQLQATAAGAYDSVFQALVQEWVNAGYKTLDFRLGWEMNLPGTPGYAGGSPQLQADWISAFQHVYTVLHHVAAADGISLSVSWSPGTTNYSSSNTLTSFYPGNNYVDVIAPDTYADVFPYADSNNPTQIHDWATGGEDSSLAQFVNNPTDRVHYWSYPAANEYSLDGSGGTATSLDQYIAFAEQQGKPLGIGETGAGNSLYGADVTDDAAYPQWLAQQLDAAEAAGVTIAYVNIWDSNAGGLYEFSNASDNKPNEAAAWAQYFGLQTVTTPSAPASTPATSVTPTTTTSSASSTTTNNSNGTVTLGSGSTTITLAMAEDYYQQNAQFTVAVDGIQIGGTQTVTAIAGDDQTEFFNLLGNWGSGTNTVTVTFLNDVYGGSPNADNNLYVEGAAENGVASPGASAVLLNDSSASLTVGGSPQGPITLGSGPDTLAITLSEQAYQGNAQVAFFVDGKQIGNDQVLTALAAVGQSQIFYLDGTFGYGNHDVSISLTNPHTNNSYPMAQPAAFVDSATIDGSAIGGAALEINNGTAQGFSFNPSGAPTDIVGSGSDSLMLYMSETGSQSSFTVSVNGKQVGPTLSTNANSNYGQSQAVLVQGNWAAGSNNTVSVNYTNPVGNGLTVETATINGATISGSSSTIYNGAANFSFAAPTVPPATVVGGSGPDTLVLNMAEDYFQGNAQFTVSIDGNQVGGVQTATAIHGLGQSQQFDVFGNLSGSHQVAVNFLNDSYGGSPALDRNLYVTSASVNGTALNNSALTLNNQGSQTIYFQH